MRLASAVSLRAARHLTPLRPPQTGDQAGPRVQHFCTGMTATWLSPERPTLLEFDGIEYPISPEEGEEEGGLQAVESLLASESEQPGAEALSRDSYNGRFICKWCWNKYLRHSKCFVLWNRLSVIGLALGLFLSKCPHALPLSFISRHQTKCFDDVLSCLPDRAKRSPRNQWGGQSQSSWNHYGQGGGSSNALATPRRAQASVGE